MSKIAVVTDTDSCIPLHVVPRLNITQVPTSSQFGEESYDTSINVVSQP
jgi:fatty acid-binding protein DegV